MCWHCPWAWWEAAAAVAMAVILLAAGLLFWRKDTVCWRVAGGVLFIVVTLISYVTTGATLRYGVNVTGSHEESRRHVLEIGFLLALYIPVWLLLLHHRRFKSPSSSRRAL